MSGELLAGTQGTVQDFLLITGKTFLAPNSKHFLRSLKLLASTTDKAETLKVVLSAVLRGAERALEAAGGESGTLKALVRVVNADLIPVPHCVAKVTNAEVRCRQGGLTRAARENRVSSRRRRQDNSATPST